MRPTFSDRDIRRGQSGGVGQNYPASGTVTPIPPTGNVPFNPGAPGTPGGPPIGSTPQGQPGAGYDPTGGYLTIADRLAQLLGSGEGQLQAIPTQTLAPAGGIGAGAVVVLVLLVGGAVWYFTRKRGS